jgi:hypothetical protein
MSHPRRDTRASSDTPEVPQASGSTSARPLDVTRQQATSAEHTWQLKDYPGGPANTKSSLIEWRPGTENHTENHKEDSIPAKWEQSAANADNRSAAAKKARETMGPERRSAAAKKSRETRQFNQAFDQYIDPDGGQ